ncbi:MAG: hypothetical protein AB7L66_01900 [Gemmatimonadales bacterium]
MTARIGLLLLLLAGVGPTAASAQARRTQRSDRCLLELVHVDRDGVRTTPIQGSENFFAGGNVHFQCRGRNIHIYSDSVASYKSAGSNLVQFISQGSRVRYRDSTTELDADFGQYYSDGERFEAQGNVVHRDLQSGSKIEGSRIDYLRPVRGLRTDLEVVAFNRPTVSYAVTDSTGRPQAPYQVIGNKVTMIGSDRLYAGGAVTIDRDDLKGAADSLWLDSGKGQGGQLVGHATLRGEQENGFVLTGRNIDISMTDRELSGLKAHDSARLVSKDVTLDADSIGIGLMARQVDVTRAWGDSVRPRAVSADYRVEGDSLVIETPNQQLRKVKAFGRGWAGFAGDTTRTERRDWIAGEAVEVSFVPIDSAGKRKNTVNQLEARQTARAWYQLQPEAGQPVGSVNYTLADRILVTMRVTPDSTTVDRVDAFGSVHGVHLQPSLRRPADTTARPDTTLRAIVPQRRRR